MAIGKPMTLQEVQELDLIECRGPPLERWFRTEDEGSLWDMKCRRCRWSARLRKGEQSAQALALLINHAASHE